jgi:hypothetical protein
MASASPSPTPNPDAMKFSLDTRLPETINVRSAGDAPAGSFVARIFEAGGVASVFGVNDFVTVTREPGADWDPIVAAVTEAVKEL